MKSDHSPSRTGHLYLVGVGPGDPELMTYKAVRILTAAKVWAVPTARENGLSSARQIAELAAAFPAARVERVDGQDLFWWGIRTHPWDAA